MMCRRFRFGPAWFGALLLAASGGAVAGPWFGPAAWAPVEPSVVPGRYLPASAPAVDWPQALPYRWRPVGVPHAAPPPPPPPPVAWGPPRGPVHPFAGPIYRPWVAGPPVPRLPVVAPPAVGPKILVLGGQPYRFRPVPPAAAPWRGPAVAQGPFVPPSLSAPWARPAVRPPPPMVVAHPGYLSPPVAWASVRVAGRDHGSRPAIAVAPDGRVVYRFRPDGRFPAWGAVPIPAGAWVGQVGGGGIATHPGHASAPIPDPRAWPLPAGLLAGVYD